MSGHRAPIVDRLWAKVDRRGPEECWPWTGARRGRGYGHLGSGGRGQPSIAAHRAVFTLTHGPIPPGMVVCHTCDNRICCNPAHLWLGTQRDNLMDMIAKGRHGMTVRARMRRSAA